MTMGHKDPISDALTLVPTIQNQDAGSDQVARHKDIRKMNLTWTGCSAQKKLKTLSNLLIDYTVIKQSIGDKLHIEFNSITKLLNLTVLK